MGHPISCHWSSCHPKSLGRFCSGTRPNRATVVHCHIAMVKTSAFGGQLGEGFIVQWVCSLQSGVQTTQKHVVPCLFQNAGVFFIDLYTRKAHFLTWENRNPAWTKMWAVKTCQDIQELRCSSIQLGNQLPKAVHGFWTRRCTPWLKVKLAILLNQDHHRKIREFHP